MQMRECVPSKLCWYLFGGDGRLLVRVRYAGRDYVAVSVATATADQVIASGYAVGDTVNTMPESLRPLREEPGADG